MTSMVLQQYLSGNWSTPKIDFSGCVFYAPLWRPDMVAKGGVISSGTGTMSVSPLALAVGANTITATGAGTFIIAIPQGGTCASGTATITGSPVTIPAGIATSVTTGVTTGNFTVTPSNIIKSQDSTLHNMTIIGPTWGYQGRTFDWVDDRIVVPNHASLNAATFSLGAWVNYTNLATKETIIFQKGATYSNPGFALGTIPDGGGHFRFNVGRTAGETTLDTAVITTSTWYCIISTFDGTTGRAYINGVADPTTSSPPSYTTSAEDLYIGDNARSLGNFSMGGTLGDLLIFNIVLTPVNVMRLYQATKWRYA